MQFPNLVKLFLNIELEKPIEIYAIKREKNSYNGNSIFKFKNNIIFLISKFTWKPNLYDNNYLIDDNKFLIDNRNIFIKNKKGVKTELSKQIGDYCVSYF